MLRKYPLAFASVLTAAFSFIQLFGIEKSFLAVVFGIVALQQAAAGQQDARSKKFAYFGIGLGIVYVVVTVAFLFAKGPEMLAMFGKK